MPYIFSHTRCVVSRRPTFALIRVVSYGSRPSYSCRRIRLSALAVIPFSYLLPVPHPKDSRRLSYSNQSCFPLYLLCSVLHRFNLALCTASGRQCTIMLPASRPVERPRRVPIDSEAFDMHVCRRCIQQEVDEGVRRHRELVESGGPSRTSETAFLDNTTQRLHRELHTHPRPEHRCDCPSWMSVLTCERQVSLSADTSCIETDRCVTRKSTASRPANRTALGVVLTMVSEHSSEPREPDAWSLWLLRLKRPAGCDSCQYSREYLLDLLAVHKRQA